MAEPQRTSTAQVVRDLLDRGYEAASRQVLAAVASEVTGGLVDQRLGELEAEAERLEAAGERLLPDNPVLSALLTALEDAQSRNRDRLNGAASGLTQAGVDAGQTISRQLTFAGMSDSDATRLGAQWNRPDPEAVAALVDFTQDSAFGEMLQGYGDSVLERIRLKATFGFTQGWGARRSARAIRRLAVGLPASQADTILRTLHLVSYRRGTAATHAANARILQPTAIRIAVLDARTCLTCIALHGRRVRLGQPVADHWQGRCTVIAQVRGFNRIITPGAAWFASLPESRQREQVAFQASPGTYAAFRDGAVTLDDFVREASDPVFGEMVFQNSLKGVLGEDARRYYRRPLP